jgi:inosine/xanthosine triphosphate pyrophosphatase family protein
LNKGDIIIIVSRNKDRLHEITFLDNLLEMIGAEIEKVKKSYYEIEKSNKSSDVVKTLKNKHIEKFKALKSLVNIIVG